MELDQEKKAQKIFYKTAQVGGVGVGLFVLSLIAPLIDNSDLTGSMQGLFVKYGLIVFAYIFVMLAVFLFMRSKIFFVNGLMQWLILPGLAIGFAYEAYKIFFSGSMN